MVRILVDIFFSMQDLLAGVLFSCCRFSDEPGGETGGEFRLTTAGRCGDASRKVVEFSILRWRLW